MPKYDATEHWAKIEVDQLDKAAAIECPARRYLWCSLLGMQELLRDSARVLRHCHALSRKQGDLFLKKDELHDAAVAEYVWCALFFTGIQQRNSMLHALSSTPRTSLPAQSLMPCSHAGTCWK